MIAGSPGNTNVLPSLSSNADNASIYSDDGYAGPSVPLPSSAYRSGDAGSPVVYQYPDGSVVMYSGGTPAWRNNNPGNVEYGQFSLDQGAIGQDGRFAIFASYSAGLNATSSLLQTNTYQSLSIDGAISRYAPSFENNTAAYQNFISNSVGVPGSTSMSALTDSQFSAVVGGIVSHEGYSRGQVITVIGAPD